MTAQRAGRSMVALVALCAPGMAIAAGGGKVFRHALREFGERGVTASRPLPAERLFGLTPTETQMLLSWPLDGDHFEFGIFLIDTTTPQPEGIEDTLEFLAVWSTCSGTYQAMESFVDPDHNDDGMAAGFRYETSWGYFSRLPSGSCSASLIPELIVGSTSSDFGASEIGPVYAFTSFYATMYMEEILALEAERFSPFPRTVEEAASEIALDLSGYEEPDGDAGSGAGCGIKPSDLQSPMYRLRCDDNHLFELDGFNAAGRSCHASERVCRKAAHHIYRAEKNSCAENHVLIFSGAAIGCIGVASLAGPGGPAAYVGCMGLDIGTQILAHDTCLNSAKERKHAAKIQCWDALRVCCMQPGTQCAAVFVPR